MKKIAELVPEEILLGSKVPNDTLVSSVVFHTRDVISNSAYFAIRGTRVDGHAFIEDALTRGASAIVVDTRKIFEAHPRTILVSSVREALALAASRWFNQPTLKLALVGITGTNGKTTTTYLLKSIWDSLGLGVGIIGTVEYFIGKERKPSILTTPDPMELQRLFDAMVWANVSHAAIEVSSIALDQDRVKGTRFKVGVFTNLTQDHLDYHGTLEAYYSAKRKFFREYGLQHAIFNTDDMWGERLYYESDVEHVYGVSLSRSHADFRAEDVNFSPRGTRAKIITPQGTNALFSPLIGKHNLYNLLASIAVSHVLGHDLDRTLQALASSTGAPGRLERAMPSGPGPHVFVDYAHTPDALNQVLVSLRELRAGSDGRMITVFGCGGDRDKLKRSRMAEVVSSLSDITIATSDNPRTENPDQILDDMEAGVSKAETRYFRERDRRKAIHLALSMAKAEDLVLIAGKGHETHQIIGSDRLPFDDREVVREYYA